MTSTGATFRSFGVTVRTSPAEIREHVARALKAVVLPQSLLLVTCSRSELFFWGDAESARVVSQVSSGLVSRSGTKALSYFYRIAAGLESPILGEYQILGQVKDAYRAAQAAGTIGKELDHIVRDAITAAKRVKTTLDIGAVPPSVCRAGVELVGRRFGFKGKRVFVIGSGKTGSLAATLAQQKGAVSLAVCNRSPERAQHLKTTLGATLVDYAAREAQVAASDIVISATASPHTVLLAKRLTLTHPTVFLDLASPRDVDPALAQDPLATVLSIDSIAEMAAGDAAERERLVNEGQVIISEAVRKTEEWLNA